MEAEEVVAAAEEGGTEADVLEGVVEAEGGRALAELVEIPQGQRKYSHVTHSA